MHAQVKVPRSAMSDSVCKQKLGWDLPGKQLNFYSCAKHLHVSGWLMNTCMHAHTIGSQSFQPSLKYQEPAGED